MNEPLVSVLMTAYNRQQYIVEAIQSVIESPYQQKKKKADKIYGSRLDQVWLPNFINKTLRDK